MKSGHVVLLLLLISELFAAPASAQDVGEKGSSAPDSLGTLKIQYFRRHRQVILRTGQTISYELRSSRNFEVAEITGFTNSMISFKNERTGDVTLPYSDLAALKVPRKGGRITGTVLTFIGAGLTAVSLAIFIESFREQGDAAYAGRIGGGLGVIIGVPILITGRLIRHDKRMDLDRSRISRL